MTVRGQKLNLTGGAALMAYANRSSIMVEERMRLEGKRAIVTGAGSDGLGRAIALALAQEGADVAVLYRRSVEGAAQVAAAITELGREAISVQADLANVTATRQTVREVIGHFGGIDILVNNAAVITRTPFLELKDEEWDQIHAVNLRGSFACAQEAARAMVSRDRGGRIIMISSVNQQIVTPDQAHYCAAKGGVMQLARAMAVELAQHGITVNLIAPGTIETDFNRHLLSDPTFRATRERPVPMGRLGQPTDIVGAAVFLASDESAYVTGASIVVDGGLSLS